MRHMQGFSTVVVGTVYRANIAWSYAKLTNKLDYVEAEACWLTESYNYTQGYVGSTACWYISVVGPYDSCYVGPFELKDDAREFAVAVRESKTFDVQVCKQAEVDANVRAFGSTRIVEPSEFALGHNEDEGDEDYADRAEWTSRL